MEHDLDLRGVACPMNFVKTRLFLDNLASGDLLHVLLDEGEPVESVSLSIAQEGHSIISQKKEQGGYFRVTISKG